MNGNRIGIGMGVGSGPQKGGATNVLAQLIRSAHAIDELELEELIDVAERSGLSLDRVIGMEACASAEPVKLALEASALVSSGKMTLDNAVKAVRLAIQERISLDQAAQALLKLHQRTVSVTSFGNEITQLLTTAKCIDNDQLARSVRKSQETGMQIIRTLLINAEVPAKTLFSALAAHQLVKEEKISREQAVQALHSAHTRKTSTEQVLFEMGVFKAPSGSSLTIGELYAMSGLLSEVDLLECLEIHLTKQKQLGQILLEQGLTTPALLETAIDLQSQVASDLLKPYQAALALRDVHDRNVPVYQALAELKPSPQETPPPMRLGDLLIESGVASLEAIEAVVDRSIDSSIKVGRILLVNQIISETMLYAALRCQSLLRSGIINDQQCVKILRDCHIHCVSFEESLARLGKYIPSRMQWHWI